MQVEKRRNRLVLWILTLITMVAFAGNSILGRVALKGTLNGHRSSASTSSAPGESAGERAGSIEHAPTTVRIDTASYTLVRIVSGALVLLLIQSLRRGTKNEPRKSSPTTLLAPCMLTIYAFAFSSAYVQLDAATGTLVLFTAVQLTMVGTALWNREFPNRVEWTGLALACGGLVYLVAPGLSLPHWPQTLMMATAGVAWGFYSILGRKQNDPIANTARNFAWSVPLTCVVFLVAYIMGGPSSFAWTREGVLLAVASGAIASGLGYVLWYHVLTGLTSAQAAAVQLVVPVIAAAGGVAFAGDSLSGQTYIGGVVILSGFALTIRKR